VTQPLKLDPALRQFATERQLEFLDALEVHGSAAQAEQALGLSDGRISKSLLGLRKRAALSGYAPGHWDAGVAPGYRMGKVTVERRNEDGSRTWERQHPELATLEQLIDRCEDRLRDFPRFKPIKAPALRTAPVTNFLGLFDLHIGAKITADDPLQCWDIPTAKRTIVDCVRHAVAVAPKAKRLVICFGGDVGHYDGLEPVTPRSKHVLHSDGSFDDLVDACLEVATSVIDIGLRTHEEVYVIWAEGNHDQASSVWMRKMLPRIYANEPRLTVVQSKTPFYALRFGKVMLCVHHGHGAKLLDYAGIFASLFREMWGLARYCYGHRGHEHHIHAKEKGGMIATQHESLCPPDDYAGGKGLSSLRGCKLMSYHDEFGEFSSMTTRPEMLEAA
jgi:hypothetical protein